MSDRIERFIAMAFEDWKKEQPQSAGHPSEEEIACFLEGRLDKADAERIRMHCASCDECAQLLAAELGSYPQETIEVPRKTLEAAAAMVSDDRRAPELYIALKMRDFGFEIVRVTGDVLFGQEFIPAAVLRSRHITDFRDEITMVRDFSAGRIEVRIQAGRDASFAVTVSAADKKTHRPLQDLRVTLSRDDIELESKVAQQGKAVFDHVPAGRYAIAVAGIKTGIGRVVIDVRP
ncbi:MAG TPA: hypothetical protein PLP56_05030 [Candidatus Omnitrophota bacterium]|nr:hypothetical protein [Candidatus Omnitrophota bacterium]HQQ06326.1 hypothetical protein [Candidatus Omnitrophota bacterium]